MMTALLALISAGLNPAQCDAFTAAHERLLNGTFRVERHVEMTVDGEPKYRSVQELTYADGEMNKELVSEEHLDDRISIRDGGSYPAFEPMNCSAGYREGDEYVFPAGDFVVRAGDDPNGKMPGDKGWVAFRIDGETGVAVPLRRWSEKKESYFFVTYEMRMAIRYEGFHWEPEPQS